MDSIFWLVIAIFVVVVIVSILLIFFLSESSPEENLLDLRIITPAEEKRYYAFLGNPRIDRAVNFTPGLLMFSTGEVIRLMNMFDGNFLSSVLSCQGGPSNQNNAVTYSATSPFVPQENWIVTVVGLSAEGFQIITLQNQPLVATDPSNSYLSQSTEALCGLDNNAIVGNSGSRQWVVIQLLNVNMIRLRNFSGNLYLSVCANIATCAIPPGSQSNVFAESLGSRCNTAWRVSKVNGSV